MDIEKLMKSEIMSPKVDIVFKLLFGDKRNERIVTSFLKAILKLDEKEFEGIEMVNTNLKPEYKSDKLSIVDVNIKTKTGKIIHIEMQVADQKEIRDRVVYYISKLLAAQLSRAQSYSELQKTISVVIADFDMITEIRDRCHNTFCLYELNYGVKFSELVEVHSLELPKILLQKDLSENAKDWLMFLKAESREEFEMVAKRNVEIGRAYDELQRIGYDDKNRALYEARLKEARDIDSRERLAFDKGIYANRLEMAQKCLQRNMDTQDISELTGFTISEVEQLKRNSIPRQII